jgi:ribosomal protein S18 acetylase RimI-like enzyme
VGDLQRASDFMSWFENSCADEVVPWRWGVTLFNREFPNVYMLNFVRVVGAPADLDIDELVASADELHGNAGHDHRDVIIEDARLGASLAPEFRARGWEVSTLLVMGYRGGGELPATNMDIRELTSEELRSIRARSLAGGPSAKDPETIRQLIAKDDLLARAAGARFFGAVVGGQTVCSADLYSNGRTAQIESVLTLEEFRQRGLGRAVVAEAVRAALASGHDFVFLVADDEDWPKDLYARMGFNPLGRFYDFLKTPD